ncbi:MAG: MTH1187 family thiamine-binding protein [Calditerricola sp.]|nr:MTH1187 family thiamine-binding protein [Calditerricola sp.]
MAILEISVTPVGTGSSSFSALVTTACRIIEEKGLPYQVTPTATVMEGPLDQLLACVQDVHRACLQNGATRLVTHITIDDRLDKPLTMSQQVETVQAQLH